MRSMPYGSCTYSSRVKAAALLLLGYPKLNESSVVASRGCSGGTSVQPLAYHDNRDHLARQQDPHVIANASCIRPEFLQESPTEAATVLKPPLCATEGCRLHHAYFLLQAEQGPYKPLPYMYGALSMTWLMLTALWIHQAFMRPSSPRKAPLYRLLAFIPAAKVFVMMLSVVFWCTCVKWGYCLFWLGVALVNCQLMYESLSLIGFVLIAKGWCITRPSFHHSEWRAISFYLVAFYLVSSCLLLVRRALPSSSMFWLCTGFLYGSAYLYVIVNVRDRLRSAQQQLRASPSRQAVQLSKTVAEYQTLSMILAVFCGLELVFCLLPLVHLVDTDTTSRWLQMVVKAAADLKNRLWLTLVIHELVEICVLSMVGYIFRPRAFSRSAFAEGDHHHSLNSPKHRTMRPPPLYLIPEQDLRGSTCGQGANEREEGRREKGLSPRDVHLMASIFSRHLQAMALEGVEMASAGEMVQLLERMLAQQQDAQQIQAPGAKSVMVVAQPNGGYAVAVPHEFT